MGSSVQLHHVSPPYNMQQGRQFGIMGGSTMDDDWELNSSSNGVRTVVLVGRTGNGKSATGNSILGTKAFDSECSLSGVTRTSTLKQKDLSDGKKLNVIDTPGFFDSVVKTDLAVQEIVKCIELAKDGLHAILVVLSTRFRFSNEEAEALRSLRTLFGNEITNYMIAIFTGGDEYKDNETLDDHLHRGCPEPLKEILDLCAHRKVLFDNKTEDEDKKRKQVDELLSLVNDVVILNHGKPYSDDLFLELQKGAMELRDQLEKIDSLSGCSRNEIAKLIGQMEKSYEDQVKRITAMVESKLSETTSRLEEQLEKERMARKRVEEYAKLEQDKSNEEMRKLQREFERIARENAEFRARNGNQCAIL